MLSSKENEFIIVIGEYGIIFALIKDHEVADKILFKEFSDNVKSNLKQRLKKLPSLPVSILLDTAEQSYKKKEYPFVNKRDLAHLINRDLAAESDKEAFLGHILINNSANKAKPAKDKRWEYLFISALTSNVTKEAIDFISDSPNRITGVYMTAIESTSLFKALKNNIKQRSEIEDKFSDIYCLVSQSKVSKVRQTVFFENQVVFTRLLDYDCSASGFIDHYEKDLVATSQYLKRLFPEVNLHDLETINILPQDSLDQIEELKNPDFKFINYTPHEAEKITSKKSSLAQKTKNSDLLLAKAFCKAKRKVLRFTTPRIKLVERMFLIMRASYFANLAALLLIASYCLFTISAINDSQETLELINAQKLAAIKSLNNTSSDALGGEIIIDSETDKEVSADKILDIAKIHENLSVYNEALFDAYYSLKFLRDSPVSVKNFNFSLPGLSEKTTKPRTYQIAVRGKILNKSGDIEDLFSEFDGLSSEFKKQYKGSKITHNELPRNIDFTKQYFDFDIEFLVESKFK